MPLYGRGEALLVTSTLIKDNIWMLNGVELLCKGDFVLRMKFIDMTNSAVYITEGVTLLIDYDCTRCSMEIVYVCTNIVL